MPRMARNNLGNYSTHLGLSLLPVTEVKDHSFCSCFSIQPSVPISPMPSISIMQNVSSLNRPPPSSSTLDASHVSSFLGTHSVELELSSSQLFLFDIPVCLQSSPREW